ncbi:amidohydrolase family protein [Phytoactinopolyspora limicola]|uniref:amidohydrolase family protein n=1 Tax=Phytoactinopolyspora limicola TaxID=2715536 RepID=UPI001409AB4C|nr:amidohydrolase family protein [Phytoactinopolyspora limicola]
MTDTRWPDPDGTRRVLIRGGQVMTMDERLGDFTPGEVLVQGDTIVAVDHQVPKDEVGEVDEVIDATGMVVLPGLVDTHIHLWQTPLRGLASELWKGEYFEQVLPYRNRYRPDDIYAGGYAGGLELLSNGVTTALDFCHCLASPAHSDAAVAGLMDSGMRGAHGYSLRDRPVGGFGGHAARLTDADRVAGEIGKRGGGRVGLMLALSDRETVDLDTSVREVAFARERGLRMTIHSNFPGQITEMNDAGLLGPDLVVVHGNVCTDDELVMLADAGSFLSVTPAVEIGLGSPFTVLGRAFRRGVRVTWGCDIPSYVDADLFGQLRLGFHLQGFVDGATDRAEGRTGRRRPGLPTLTPHDILRFATRYGAAALGLDERIGSLTPGKQADLVILRTPPGGPSVCGLAAHVLLQSGARDVDTVMVAGMTRVRGGHGPDEDMGRADELVRDTRHHVLAEPVPAE